MTSELKWLAFSTLFGLASILIAGAFGAAQRGLLWNAGNRDGEARSLTGAAARAVRANANFLETFPLFAAAALVVVVSNHGTPHTAFGAALYFWARLVYLPVYIIGIAYLRTLVWAISIWGLLQVIEALL